MTPFFLVWLVGMAPGVPAPDVMQEFNGQFRSAYKSALLRVQADLESVILCFSGDRLVWLHKGARRELPFLPKLYRDLKTMAHLPLTVQTVLEREAPGPLTQEAREAVGRMLLQRRRVKEALGTMGFSPVQKERQQRILELCEVFAENALKEGHFEAPDRMHEFFQTVRKPVYDNVRDAARLHVDSLHRHVQDIRREMGEALWSKSRTVVITSHVAAAHEASIQYFEKAMGIDEENDRLVFAEYPCDEACALTSLARHVYDVGIGNRLFDDPERMHRDVMADAVQDYLNEVPVAAAPGPSTPRFLDAP